VVVDERLGAGGRGEREDQSLGGEAWTHGMLAEMRKERERESRDARPSRSAARHANGRMPSPQVKARGAAAHGPARIDRPLLPRHVEPLSWALARHAHIARR